LAPDLRLSTTPEGDGSTDISNVVGVDKELVSSLLFPSNAKSPSANKLPLEADRTDREDTEAASSGPVPIESVVECGSTLIVFIFFSTHTQTQKETFNPQFSNNKKLIRTGRRRRRRKEKKNKKKVSIF
jgi:hypothetical protein